MNDGEVAALLEHARQVHRIPALAAAVVRDGRIQALAAAGCADLASGRPARVDQPSRWYSITKGLTVLAVLDQAQRGRLDLDAPLTRLLPELRFANVDATAHASLRDCLLHRSGLTAGNWTWDGAEPDPDTLLAKVGAFPCPTRAGEGFAYQNLHFTLIERTLAASGTDWHQAIADLANRLGITCITDQDAFLAADRFAPHGPNGLDEPQPIADVEVRGVIAGAGGCGSIRDLAGVAGMVAGNGVWQGREIVARGWWETATAPLVRGDDSGPGPERGERRSAMIGSWSTYRGQRLLAWGGGFRGYTSHLIAIPALGLAACALGNRSDSPCPEAVCLELLDRAAGWPAVDWPERFRSEKLALRKAGAARLAHRVAQPVGPLPAVDGLTGTFHHPGYGDLTIRRAGSGLQLGFRSITLPLVPRQDGRWSADGVAHGLEWLWDLRLEVEGDRVLAWHFNPDAPDHPARFRAVDPTSG